MTMKTAVVNQKGGVGKTATTINVGGALAELGRQVLLIDLDPQGHLTDATGKPASSGEATLPAALTGAWDGPAEQLVVEHSRVLDVGGQPGRLALIPNALEMFTVARELDKLRAREHRLQRFVAGLASTWDHVLFDCPPSLDILTDNALTAADGVLVPVQAEDSSLKALRLLLAQVEAVDADLRDVPLQLHGLVVSLLRRPPTMLARSVLDAFEAMPLPVLATVPQAVVVTEAWRLGQTIPAYAPESEHAEAYRTLAKVIDGAAA